MVPKPVTRKGSAARFTALSSEVAAINLAVVLANGCITLRARGATSRDGTAQFERDFTVIEEAAAKLIARDLVEFVDDDMDQGFFEAMKAARLWLLAIARGKSGRGTGGGRLRDKALAAFARNDPRGKDAWRKNMQALNARAWRLSGDALNGQIAHALLEWDCQPTFKDGRLRSGDNQASPMAWAAYGAALLLDKSCGYAGKTKFFPFQSRFGLCERPGCGCFYFYGPGTKGGDHKHCSSRCANNHRQLRFRKPIRRVKA
jgi:hypothetical protein